MTSSVRREGAILVVMPAYNEEESVGNVIAEVRRAVPESECLVIDDGSRDSTTQAALRAGATVITLPYNLGVGGAMRTGLKYASANRYERVVRIDADGQHDPVNIPELIARLAESDIVVGARFAGAGDYQARGPRRWAMVLLAAILSKVAGNRLTDTTSGFKAFGPRAINLLAEHYPAEFLGDTVEALVIAARSGCAITQVPVEMRVRQAGVPSNGAFKATLHLARVFVAVFFALLRPAKTYSSGYTS